MLAARCTYSSMIALWGGPRAGHGPSDTWFAAAVGCRDVEPRSLSMSGKDTLAHTHTHTHTQGMHPGPGTQETYPPYAISVAPQKTLPAKASTALIRSAEVPTPPTHASGAQAQKAENTAAPIPPAPVPQGLEGDGAEDAVARPLFLSRHGRASTSVT